MNSDDFLLSKKNDLIKEARAGQVAMGRMVEKVIRNPSFGVIEAPTGTGKTFAYAVPAILSGKRVVISTAKKQLQHQIFKKDLPYLQQKMGIPFSYSLLKGKGNYACKLKSRTDIVDREARVRFNAWLDHPATEYGDLSEYPGKRPSFWGDVSAEDCIGKKCKFHGECKYAKAVNTTAKSSILVVNHHVVAFDLRYGPGKILGEYDVLIIDEAHQAPSSFRDAFSTTITQWGYRRLARALDRVGMATLGTQLEKVWGRMFALLHAHEGEVIDPFGVAGAEALSLLDDILSEVKTALKEEGYVVREDGGFEFDKGGGSLDWEHIGHLEMVRRPVDRYKEALKRAQKPDDNTVSFFRKTERGDKLLTVSPISVGGMVGPKLYQIPTVVVTSATIAVNGNFQDIRGQLGLDWRPKPDNEAPPGVEAKGISWGEPRNIEQAILPSPFDYKRQALLYTPKHLPLPEAASLGSPDREAYLAAMASEIHRLILSADGNAFVLFSSGNDLREVQARLSTMPLNGITIIAQADDAEAAFKEYMATPRSVILGLKSFWEGVDVVGDKLRLVIIVKLPFPQMNDPVVQARTRQLIDRAVSAGKDERTARGLAFGMIQTPTMIIDLRQGVGRLIRSSSDRGVCAILDARIWTGSGKRRPSALQKNYEGYGSQAINSIGFPQRVSDFGIVEKFLNLIKRG